MFSIADPVEYGLICRILNICIRHSHSVTLRLYTRQSVRFLHPWQRNTSPSMQHLPAPEPRPRGYGAAGAPAHHPGHSGNAQRERSRDAGRGQAVQLRAGAAPGHLHQPEAGLLPQQAVQARLLRAQ